ncbi:MAG: hypothetical protein E7335_07625 [Clostridiales bacterium]|nr:hypothetical protein [Clostridiales bacterium]
MYRITNVKIALDADVRATAARMLKLAQSDILDVHIRKKSVDARDKADVHFVISMDVETKRRVPFGQLVEAEEFAPIEKVALRARPVVVGLGPAGLFAALTLAEAGACPIVVERGRRVEDRKRDVSAFWAGGDLDETSNVQFGEGGAGAFSDGKLTTGIKSEHIGRVLRTLHECGAPEDILYMAKPHIGTDKLTVVVRNIRERILSLGGEIFFEHCLTGLKSENGSLTGVVVKNACGEEKEIPASAVILAVGHSARDTFEMLMKTGVRLEPKPFSIGARIEHKQTLIDRSQYGQFAGHPALGAAEYKLSARLPDGRGIYTFCMCPGGRVIAAASEKGGVVVNGMSEHARAAENANSALLVDVRVEDFGADDPLAGVRFARAWEQRAFGIGGYRAPAQLVGDFLKNKASSGAGSVKPSYQPGVTWMNLSECLPDFAVQGIRGGIEVFDRRLRGFAQKDAVLTGVETRSSSPVRIPRGESCEASLSGLFPCGEGAGYAGGITSAAVDGIRCALALMEKEKK